MEHENPLRPVTDEQLSMRLQALRVAAPDIDPARARSLVATAGRPPRRRALAAIVAAGVAIAALAVPTAAVAGKLFEAQTHSHGVGGSDTIDDDEWVSNSAPDFAEYLAEIAPRHLPVPGGFDWDAAAAMVAERRGGEPALMQRIGLIRSFETLVWTAWVDEWISAHAAGDTERMASAVTILHRAPNWPAFIATDGGGVRYIMWALVNRMAEGDAEAAQLLAQQEGSQSWDGIHRDALASEIFAEWLRSVGDPEIIDHRDPGFQRLYAEALREISGGIAE